MKKITIIIIFSLLGVFLCAQPSGAAEPKKIVVDQSGKGDHQTITAALAVASPGDIILVRTGLYREDPVFISGVTVEGQDAGGVNVELTHALSLKDAQNVTLKSLNFHAPSDVLEILNCKKIAIENCAIACDTGKAVFLNGSTDVLIKECSLSGNGKAVGVMLQHAQARWTGGIISDFGLAVVLKDSSQADIENNFFDTNKIAIVAENSKISVKKNTIIGTREGSGILFQNSQAVIVDNSIRRCNIGIEAAQVNAEIMKNTITQNELGIIGYSGSFKISGNVILSNRLSGILLNGIEAAPGVLKEAAITRNSITGNGAAGIGVAGFKAAISYNLIEANKRGIIINESEVSLVNNTIVLQEMSGMELQKNSAADIYNNIIAFNRCGIVADIAVRIKCGFNDVYWNLLSKDFPLADGNYERRDYLVTGTGEKIYIAVSPAYDLKGDTDFSEYPKFVKPGSDYRLTAGSALSEKKGRGGAFIGAFAPAVNK